VRDAIDQVRLRQTLQLLPAPRVRGLLPEVMAATDGLVLDAFRSAGWRAELRRFEEHGAWAWTTAPGWPPVKPVAALAGVNVVAVKEGTSPDAIVLVAHHDTVPGTGGADDNGSGVVALMELARLLAPVRPTKSVVLAAVDHEELGFLGSRQLVSELTAERRIVAAVVFEMLAYTSIVPGSQQLPPAIGAVYRGQVRKIRANAMRGDFIAVIYPRRAQALATCFSQCLAHLAGTAAVVLLRPPTDLPVLGPVLNRTAPFARDFAQSDHVSFWQAGLPAIQITDTAYFRNPHYHRSSDTPDTLDYHRLADVIAATALTVERMAGTDTLGSLRRSP
jgi:Zn-dependent M28 family amino/carboxypeptidase